MLIMIEETYFKQWCE